MAKEKKKLPLAAYIFAGGLQRSGAGDSGGGCIDENA